MTDTQYDRALGDELSPTWSCTTSSGVLVYTIGLALAVVLSAMSVLGNYLDGRI
jgi:cytochrome o ubiquinol oxidase subunit IV